MASKLSYASMETRNACLIVLIANQNIWLKADLVILLLDEQIGQGLVDGLVVVALDGA